MSKSIRVIKDVVTQEGHSIKLWRETQYRKNGLETTFFIDMRSDGMLVMRQPYPTINEALDAYYSLISSALRYGQELHKVRV